MCSVLGKKLFAFSPYCFTVVGLSSAETFGGSRSYAGPAEVDHDVVVGSRFIADSREGVLHQGAELLRAKATGLIDDDHIAGEIGQALASEIAGRRSADEITVYKSLA